MNSVLLSRASRASLSTPNPWCVSLAAAHISARSTLMLARDLRRWHHGDPHSWRSPYCARAALTSRLISTSVPFKDVGLAVGLSLSSSAPSTLYAHGDLLERSGQSSGRLDLASIGSITRMATTYAHARAFLLAVSLSSFCTGLRHIYLLADVPDVSPRFFVMHNSLVVNSPASRPSNRKND